MGGAPLALGALGVLAASRGVLAGTVARRQKIQEDIAQREAAKKAKIELEADAGGLATAAVSCGMLCAFDAYSLLLQLL